MKFPIRSFVSLITILVLAAQIKPVQASSAVQAVTSNPAAEEYVKSELLDTGMAVLGSKFRDPQDRGLSGAFIAGLFKDPDLQINPFIKIYNATIVGDINADGVTIPFNVEFHDCVFEGRINLDSAEVKTFRIDDSTVKGSVRMGRLVSKGDVALYRSTFEGEVTLFDAAIVGNLFARSSKFNGVNKDDNSKYPFELWKARVAQSTEFTNSVFKGEVSADYAVFGTDVKFDGTTFKQPARFKNVQFNDIADFRGSIFMEAATFENSIVKRDIQFTDAKFRNEANFKYLSVGRFLNFSNNPLNIEDFMGDEGSKELNELKGTIFSGAVNLEGVKVGDVLDFRNASSAELLKISLAEVNGQTLFEKFISPDGLDLSHNHFGDLKIIGQQGKEFAGINLDATSINGDLYIQDVDVTNDFSAQDLVAKDSTTFMKLKVNRDLNLSNASLGSFTMSSDQFWTKPDETKNGIIYYLNLRGATYANIGFATLDGDELRYQEFKGGQAGFLGEMVAASEYSPQAYRTLETFLTEKGRSSNAADIEYDRKVRERDSLAPWSPAWVLSWFRWVFSGYGKYPWLAFLWSLILITISAVVFWYQEDLTKDQKESPGKLFFYCFLYSFFLFFTFVVLEFTKDWEPKKTETSFKVYKQFHKMLGLLIAPTAVLVFGGLIK